MRDPSPSPVHAGVHVEYVGKVRSPVVIVDDFYDTPQALIEHAASTTFAPRSRFYPGVRAPAPARYIDALRTRLATVLKQQFGWTEDLAITECNLSLLTTPAAQLVPFQRIPHIDGTESDVIAVLHYLCDPDHGGTAFYRHRSTGLELLTPETVNAYMDKVNSEVRLYGMPPAQFINGDTAMFEQLARFDAKMNRALIYTGALLHSGNIPASYVPQLDPRRGRLTVNTFVRLSRAWPTD